MISVLLADDSALTRMVVKDLLRSAHDISVVGEAENGKEAVEMTSLLRPDLVIIDLLMPVMDGLSAIETIMADTPTPILVLSATIDEREVSTAFNAIKKGALDVMEKPEGVVTDAAAGFAARLIDKVRMLARIKVIRRWPRSKTRITPVASTRSARPEILAIGASTGGPKAVMKIVRALPADFSGKVYIVQHIASGFAKGFAQWLNSESSITVRLAANGDVMTGGEALVAPNDCHMIMDGGKIRLVDEQPVNCCRPSVDVFFNSLAVEWGTRTVGVLLTGMGKDGAQGLLQIKENGGVTLVQDEESSAVFGMPKAAIALNAAEEVIPLDTLPETINRLFAA
jgi:two-component system chemotaxis response regulator CheB